MLPATEYKITKLIRVYNSNMLMLAPDVQSCEMLKEWKQSTG
jgi:hypothetical protein